MKFNVTFKLQNSDYNKEYAEQYHEGKESENNWKTIWSESWELSSIKEYKVIKDKPFQLKGQKADGTEFDYAINNVTIVDCLTTDNHSIEIVVSNKLIKKTHVARKQEYDITRFYFYFKDGVENCKVTDLIYIAVDDMPQELLHAAALNSEQ